MSRLNIPALSYPGLLPSILCAGLLGLTACSDDAASATHTAPDIFTVKRGDLRIHITESAELRASQETRVKSEVEGQATVIYLIPEGTRVDKGEKLVELDVSSLEDKLATQKITVTRAKAALVNAQQDMKILEKEIAADAAEARSKVEIAEIDLEKFFGRQPAAEDLSSRQTSAEATTNRDMLAALTETIANLNKSYVNLPNKVVAFLGEENLDREMGEMGQAIIKKIDEIENQEATLALSKDTLTHSINLAEHNYITSNDLTKDKLKARSDSSRLKLYWNELDLLISYSQRKDKISLELALSNAVLFVEKTDASANAKRARQESELSSKDSEHQLATERLDNLNFQIAHAIIRAPTPGLVVYATQGDGRRGREVVEEGSSVRERQTLIVLPDTSTMVAHLKVQEADIDSVVDGQGAIVKIDAYQDQAFTGKVSRVSPLPDSGSRWSNNDLKVYKTEVTLANHTANLRPNMTAEVEILVGSLLDVIYVPIPAVRRQGIVHYVWTKTPEGPVAELVTLGRNNLANVEIASGAVKDGTQVYLAPPEGFEAPKFAQPEKKTPEIAVLSEEETKQKQAEQKKAREGGGNKRGSGAQGGGQADFMKLYGEYKALALQKLPQFKDKIEGNRRWSRDAEIKAAVQADPELKAMADKISAAMSSFRGGGGGGNRQRGEGGGNQQRGGDRQGGSERKRGGGERGKRQNGE